MASAEDVLTAVLHSGAALSVGCVVVWALRPLLLRSLGAHAAYLAWLVVPCAMLPTLAVSLNPEQALPAAAWPAVLAPVTQAAPALPAPTGTQAAWLCAAWAAGLVGLLLLALQRQRRFSAALRAGALADLGPVVVGAWRPRVWLPADFEQRFDAFERALILAHERVHLCRHDNAWNLLAFAALASQWFNPLAWWAWHRMRLDQELSCDALALLDCATAGDAAAPARYVRALLKAQGLGDARAVPAGLNAAAFFSHPLVERIRVLKNSPASLPRRVAAARALALTAALLAATIAAALESPKPARPSTSGPAVTTLIEMQVDGRTVASPRVMGRYGEPIAVAVDDAAGIGPLEVSIQLSARPDDHVLMTATLRSGVDRQVIATPKLLTRDQTPARVETTTPDGAHTVAMTFTPALPKPAR